MNFVERLFIVLCPSNSTIHVRPTTFSKNENSDSNFTRNIFLIRRILTARVQEKDGVIIQ